MSNKPIHNGLINVEYLDITEFNVPHMYVQVTCMTDNPTERTELTGFLNDDGTIGPVRNQYVLQRTTESNFIVTYKVMDEKHTTIYVLFDDREFRPVSDIGRATYAIVGVQIYKIMSYSADRGSGSRVELLDLRSNQECTVPISAVRIWLDTVLGGVVTRPIVGAGQPQAIAMTRYTNKSDPSKNESLTAYVDKSTTSLRMALDSGYESSVEFSNEVVQEWVENLHKEIQNQPAQEEEDNE